MPSVRIVPVANFSVGEVVEDGVSREVKTPYAPKEAQVFDLSGKLLGTIRKVVLRGESWWQPEGTNRYYEQPQPAAESFLEAHVAYHSTVAKRFNDGETVSHPSRKTKTLKRGKASHSSKRK